ncbi:glycosyltransferase [Planctomycetota bacterium]
MSGTTVQIEDDMRSADQADLYEEKILRDWPAERLLAANLAALAERDKAQADTIAKIIIPETVQMSVARDGSVTFRRRGEDGRFTWLGYSTVPLMVARANLKRTEISVANMAMNGIGAGAEAAGILHKMAGHQALLVVENDPLALNLVLQLRDLTDYLRSGRLILLLGGDPVELFEKFYEEHPGYALVDQATTWPWLSDRENQAFAQKVSLAMQRVSKKTWAKMKHLADEQKAYDRQTTLAETVKCLSQPDSCRAANCTDANTPNNYCAGRDGLAGLEQFGISTDWLVFDRPEYGSQYAQLARLNRVKPHLILLVDKLRKDIALSLPESAVCLTLLRQPGPAILKPQMPPAQRMGPNDFVFPAQHQQYEQLEQAGFPSERLVYLPLGANTDLFRPMDLDDADRQRYAGDIILITQKHSINPETYQIKLPTHQQLFQAIIEEIKNAPDKYHHDDAPRFLQRAQRCGIELREDDLRNFFIELIQQFLGDMVMADTYGDALRQECFEVNDWYWSGTPEVIPGEHSKPTWETNCPPSQADKVIGYGEKLNKLYKMGKIFLHISGAGFPDGYLLNGIAAGAFFLVRAHPRDNQIDGIGEMFELGRELIVFDTPNDLVRKVRYFLSHDQEREEIARAGRQKLLTRHSYKIRARQMLDAIIEGIK